MSSATFDSFIAAPRFLPCVATTVFTVFHFDARAPALAAFCAARSRDNGGAGIGLTISKALIEAHSGTLTATSPGPGRGAVFALRLPLSPPDSEEAAR